MNILTIIERIEKMKRYVNHETGKVYSIEELGLDRNEIPDENHWTEITINIHGLPEIVID